MGEKAKKTQMAKSAIISHTVLGFRYTLNKFDGRRILLQQLRHGRAGGRQCSAPQDTLSGGFRVSGLGVMGICGVQG